VERWGLLLIPGKEVGGMTSFRGKKKDFPEKGEKRRCPYLRGEKKR